MPLNLPAHHLVQIACALSLPLMFITIPVSAMEMRYQTVSISADQQVLTIRDSKGSSSAPVTEEDQVGFQSAALSADHKSAGWLALTKNCCTSYPIPTALLILRNGKIIRRFDEVPPVWAWRFVGDGSSVAYRQSTVHGSSVIAYTLRRVVDGKILARFTCMPNDTTSNNPDAPEFLMSGPVPAWVRPVAHECPTPEQK
ncbi:hypothetical protein [Undibacterium sp. TS12]|uniref:hypothetical protein n=1 Tax=Undibacterium sp. TS12 TaxID=2908202 RepID=UPI001F4C7D5D|nr:hypothetical protein [Undibacterium sp. TS12]MCH8619326.1 hypothetical protein [Undibacterium sp. TS12]